MNQLDHFDRFRNLNTELDHTQELLMYQKNKEFGKLYLNLLASNSTDNLTKMLQYFSPKTTYSNPLLEKITLLEFYCFMYLFLIKTKSHNYKYEFVSSNENKVKMRSLLTYTTWEDQEVKLLIDTILHIQDDEIIHIEEEFDLESWITQNYKLGKILGKLQSFRNRIASDLLEQIQKIANKE